MMYQTVTEQSGIEISQVVTKLFWESGLKSFDITYTKQKFTCLKPLKVTFKVTFIVESRISAIF